MPAQNPTSTLPFHKKFLTCVLCDHDRLDVVLPLKPSALAEAYVPAEKLDIPQPAYPMDLYLCRGCGHVQLLDVIEPSHLFSHYSYVSASSPGLAAHFSSYADRVAEKLALPAKALVIDIGSNDGTLLRFFQKKGMRVLGVDPAQEIAARTTAQGIETVAQFFQSSVARELAAKYGRAKLITANNVFAHSRALPDMADGIRDLLDKDGVFVFEVSYLPDMIANMVFDFVYHEHLCHHAVKSLDAFLRRHGLCLIDAERVLVKGGSLRGYAQRLDGPRIVADSIPKLLQLETEMGIDQPATFAEFARRIDSYKQATVAVLDKARASGVSVAGYGASATVTTLVHHFELAEKLDFLVDDNPMRHHTFSPGHHIPVLPSSALYEKRPGLVLVAAWRFADSILQKHQEYVKAGGHFYVPIPAGRYV